ncbi:MAG: response regulator [Nitrospinae bacterium]|nr:response regulator [Nitrospinota bacterium]
MTEPISAAMFGSKAGLGRVMVVEGESGLRDQMRLTLETEGYDVLEAETADKAIKIINEGENPLLLDVVITDIDKSMGTEAVNYFKREFPHVPLIVLTGFLEQQKGGEPQTKVALLGAGKGGTALLDVFSHLPSVQVIGIYDKIPGAPGLKRARELNVPIVDDPVRLIGREDLDLIVDVTGDPGMKQVVAEQKNPKAEVLGGGASKLLWTLIQHEKDMQAQLFNSEKLAGMIKEGINDFILKPVAKDRLIRAVAAAMEQREIHKL